MRAADFEEGLAELAAMAETIERQARALPADRWEEQVFEGENGWNRRQLLAHLATINLRHLMRLAPPADAVNAAGLPPIDVWNDEQVAGLAACSVDDLLGDLRTNRGDLVALLRTLTPQQRDAFRFPRGDASLTLQEWIPFVLQHDRTHLAEITGAQHRARTGVAESGRVLKTAAAQILDRLSAAYEIREYQEQALTAEEAAEKLDLPLDRVFKTLVVRGDPGGVVLACLPGSRELDLRALARESGNKRVALVSVEEIHRLTGYLRGGVSPLGSRRRYPLYLDDSARRHESISVSAGMRGMQLLLRPDDCICAAGATVAPIAVPVRP